MALKEPLSSPSDRLNEPPAGQRRITLLGATGSVGSSTIDLICQAPDRYSVQAVTANRNVDQLADIARKVRAAVAVITNETLLNDLRDRLSGTGIEVAAGLSATIEAAARPADLVVGGIVGSAGLAPALAAIKTGASLALANKECLVCAGSLFIDQAKRAGAAILPIDSEHNAIFQVLDRGGEAGVERLILTASGGPFRTASLASMQAATPADALAHPVWDMGAKISIDSATMMNKGLEIIEAHFLFDMPAPKIEVVVHPQSIVHSLVGYADGSVLAQLGCPDMRIPIAHALAYPDRMPTNSPRLDLAEIGQLTFEQPDTGRFRSLELAREALSGQVGQPAVLNAANEIAVEFFLGKRLGFMDIPALVEETISVIDIPPITGLDDVMMLDDEARRKATELVTGPLFTKKSAARAH